MIWRGQKIQKVEFIQTRNCSNTWNIKFKSIREKSVDYSAGFELADPCWENLSYDQKWSTLILSDNFNKLAIQSQVLVQWTIIWRQNDNFAISSRINYYLQFTLEEYIRQVESKTDSFISSTVYSSNPFPVTNLNSFRGKAKQEWRFFTFYFYVMVLHHSI